MAIRIEDMPNRIGELIRLSKSDELEEFTKRQLVSIISGLATQLAVLMWVVLQENGETVEPLNRYEEQGNGYEVLLNSIPGFSRKGR